MKKSLFAFFASLSLALAGASAFSKAGFFSVKAESESAPRFENEVEADRNELAFTLTSSSLTPCSQSFTLSMQSVKIEAYNNSTRYNNVFVRIDDSNYTDFQTAKKNAEDAKEAAENEGKEYVPAVYNATVFNVANSKAANNVIVLPNFIDYGTLFRLQVTSIEANACYDYDSKSISYANIKEIIIPEGYQKISANAFLGAKEAGVAIKTASASAGENWEEGWTDADVEYGVTLTSTQQRALEVRTTGTTTFGEGKSFFVGYFDKAKPETNKPLTMEYHLLDSGNNPVGQTQYYELPKASTTLDYDAVGTIAGKAKDDRSVDIEIPEGTHIDESSIVFHNILRLAKNEQGKVVIEPDSEPLKATPTQDDFLVYGYSGANKEECTLNAKVKVTCTLKYYVSTSTEGKYNVETGNIKAVEIVEPGDAPVVVEEITTTKALEIINGLEDGATSDKEYVVTGYVNEVTDAYSTQHKSMSLTLGETKDATDLLTVFRAKLNSGTSSSDVIKGAKIKVSCYLQKYVKDGAVTPEATKGTITLLEAVKGETKNVTVAEALAAAEALPKDGVSADVYVITGFVTKIKSAWVEKYGNMSVYLSDTAGDANAKFIAFQVECSEEESAKIVVGAKVKVTGKVTNYYGNTPETVGKGAAKIEFLEAPQA